VEARTVVILLPDGDVLRTAAGAGQLDVDHSTAIPLAGTTAGEVLRSGRSRRTSAEHLIAPSHVGIPDAQTVLMVPLAYRGRSLGLLMAFDRLTGDVEFAAEDQHVLEAFAASAATAVATAQTVEAERLRRSLEAAEQERGRWARELHDETLQGLGALRVLLSGAARSDDLDKVRASLGAAVEHVGHEIDNLRGIIADRGPPPWTSSAWSRRCRRWPSGPARPTGWRSPPTWTSATTGAWHRSSRRRSTASCRRR
jgi:signal transduction histidine kinase